VFLRGEIDLATGPALERELQKAEHSGPQTIVLDLADLRFIDSTGVHLLIRAQRRADTHGHGLVLRCIPAQAQRLFSLTGIVDRITTE
jgi:anti-sigma B factor antagonist